MWCPEQAATKLFLLTELIVLIIPTCMNINLCCHFSWTIIFGGTHSLTQRILVSSINVNYRCSSTYSCCCALRHHSRSTLRGDKVCRNGLQRSVRKPRWWIWWQCNWSGYQDHEIYLQSYLLPKKAEMVLRCINASTRSGRIPSSRQLYQTNIHWCVHWTDKLQKTSFT